MTQFLRRFGFQTKSKALEPAVLSLGGRAVAVAFRRNAQARRLIIRLSRDRSGVVVTVPPRASRAEALDFAMKSARWIAARLTAEPAARPLAAGMDIPVRGLPTRIVHAPGRRGAVSCAEGALTVAGGEAHLPRRVIDWLKAEARRDLLKASEHYAEAMAVDFRKLTLRDQKSRWGSCSSDGTLSYSWRLILAPSFVLDYVAAHEVAHLRHMNHGARFWRFVLTHCAEAARAKAWLKRHGAALHAYGR